MARHCLDLEEPKKSCMSDPYRPLSFEIAWKAQRSPFRRFHAFALWGPWLAVVVSFGWGMVALVDVEDWSSIRVTDSALLLASISTAQLLMVFAIRWILLRFMLRGTTIGSRKALLHFEFLSPNARGTGFRVIKNVHVPLTP